MIQYCVMPCVRQIMEKISLPVLLLGCVLVFTEGIEAIPYASRREMELAYRDTFNQYLIPPLALLHNANSPSNFKYDGQSKSDYGHPEPQLEAHLPPTLQKVDPLLAALLLSSSLGLSNQNRRFNHPDHLPVNPYLALLLSHFGKYVAVPGVQKGIYGYVAVNNYHNNKPFGAYKVYEDIDG